MLAAAFSLCVAPLVVFVGGIVGVQLAPVAEWATLPVAAMIVGTACSVTFVAKAMQIWGRKPVFLGGCALGFITALMASLSIFFQSFWAFVVSTFVFGACLAIVQQYRFAAMESTSIDKIGRAASIVLVGGLLAAFLGPELATIGSYFDELLRDAHPEQKQDPSFVGAFLALAVTNLIAAVLLCFYSETKAAQESVQDLARRSLSAIVKQPVFILAVLSSGVGYAVMSFIMTATPVSMHHIDAFTLTETKWVIQSHILAMYLPSFFSGYLIDRLGARSIMKVGVAIYMLCLAIALSGQHWLHYWGGLVVLGIGWNFLFVAGTHLLSESYRHDERFKAQGFNDFVVFALQAAAALTSGAVIFAFGWNVLIIAAIPMIMLLLTMIHREARLRRNMLEFGES